MTADPITKLRLLHAAAERISANLVELELDSSRQLLAASTLKGESAAQWTRADATLTELWRQHGLLEDLLERADGLAHSRHSNELRELLDGPSVELAGIDVPLKQRSLLGSARAGERCSPEELLATMSAAFDEVKLVVGAIGEAWETLVPRLDGLRQTLEDARRLADEVGEVGRGDMKAAAQELDRLRAALTDDPLSVDPNAVDAAGRALDAIHADLEQSAGLKRGFDARTMAARELLEQLRNTIRQAEVAHHELKVKIAIPNVPAAQEETADLAGRLTEIAELAEHGAWRDARRALANLTAQAHDRLAAAERALAANRAPIAARNQYRAMLEAYQVKAKRLGRLEDAELAATFARAHEALYTAPTDLAAAAQLVRRYQQALSGSSEEARS